MNISFLILSLFFFSCSRVKTISLKEHDFGKVPKKIVWLQIPGLSIEQISLIRFGLLSANQVSEFEKMTCVGKMWNFNLFDIRPNAKASLMSQIVGNKNINSNCSDYRKTPIWNYLSLDQGETGVLENGVLKKNSLTSMNSCKSDSEELKKNLTIWSMSNLDKTKSKEYFHFQDHSKNLIESKVYFDKACHSGKCFSDIYENSRYLFEKSFEDKLKYLFIIRDYSILNSLKRRNVFELREHLLMLNKLIAYFKSKQNDEILLVVSSAEAMDIELPRKGKQWAEFEKKGSGVIFKRSKLLSPVFASGPNSENFCGIYEESEIMKRFIWRTNSKSPIIKELF